VTVFVKFWGAEAVAAPSTSPPRAVLAALCEEGNEKMKI
jgi:hypothetical protein